MSTGVSCPERSAGGNRAHMTETPREDDSNDELDQSPIPDPEKPGGSEDDPETD